MIIQCSKCGKKNKLDNSLLGHGVPHCGSCKAILDIPQNDENVISDFSEHSKEYISPYAKKCIDTKEKAKIEQKTEQWKSRLLDLTKRNRSLYFKVTKTTFRITSPDLQTLFNKLVIDETALIFPYGISKVIRADSQELFPQEKVLLEEQIKHGDLVIDIEPDKLMNGLYKLHRDCKNDLTERGVNTLFLSLGVLQWKESENSEQIILAPLILIPVSLTRKTTQEPYRLEPFDEEPILNPTLNCMLERNFGISMPEFSSEDEKTNIVDFLSKIQKIVEPKGWNIHHESYLCRLSFEKLPLYQDINQNADEINNYPITKILSGLKTDLPTDKNISIEEIDKIEPSKLHPVLNADSSQMEVLARAQAGQNLVVQGPPGTGKSQTIANLIAQCLYERKKVLFVSEKMAALDMVFKRLKQVGLSPTCLELHSHKSSKNKVITELGNTLYRDRIGDNTSNSEQNFNKLFIRRQKLNQYVKELHKKRGVQGKTAYDTLGKLVKIKSAPNIQFDLPFSSAMALASEDEEQLISVLERLSKNEVTKKGEDHPWRGAKIETDNYSPLIKDKIEEKLCQSLNIIEELMNILKKLNSDLGIKIPGTLLETKKIIELIDCLSECPELPLSLLNHNLSEIKLLHDKILEASRRQDNLNSSKYKMEEYFNCNLLNEPIKEIISELQKHQKSLFPIFSESYRNECKRLKPYWKKRSPITFCFRNIYTSLQNAITVTEEKKWVENHNEFFSEYLQDFYRGVETDWHKTLSFVPWVVKILHYFEDGIIPSQLKEMFDKIGIEHLKQVNNQLKERLNTVYTDTIEKVQSIETNIFPQKSLDKISASNFIVWVKIQINNIKALDEWVDYCRIKKNCIDLELTSYLTALVQTELEVKYIVPTFQKRLLKQWVSETYHEVPILREFTGENHEELRKQFVELDKLLSKSIALSTLFEWDKRAPYYQGNNSTSDLSQLGIMMKETKRQRRHKPLRWTFDKCAELIQDLKPCFLMSPLSVATYLSKGRFNFDIVIFDEASQIHPADAISPILRGKQLVLAGDSKQLPPTSFFKFSWNEEEDIDETDEEFSLEDLESILDTCAASPYFRQCSLLWHYRSKYEPLITFSNREFYNGRLITFPHSALESTNQCVEFTYIPDGIYDRGKNRSKTNIQEARKIVELIIEHAKNYGNNKTLGVITLNIQQEELIDRLLREELNKYPELSELFAEDKEEPIFIKNLERVQGDERDYIIISICYGKDSQGAMSMNFGPINQAGGERRLNVAVTRAREKTTIVCSMRPHEIDLARLTTKNPGVPIFQKYLEYAYHSGGKSSIDTISTDQPESVFEECVRDALIQEGYKIDCQVGCSAFRIDLAIRHPDNPGRYILGIECDGKAYHSAKTARDRDRLRQEVLEGLGWKIFRIWGTDWFSDDKNIIDKLNQRVNEIKAIPITEIEKLPKTQKENYPETLQSKPNGNNDHGKNKPTKDLPYYSYYKPKVSGTRESFYRNQREVVEVIREIIKHESPIHKEAIIRRVADIYNTNIGSNIKLHIESAITRIRNKSKDIHLENNMLWYGNNKEVQPRLPRPDDSPRPINEISIEELQSAGKYILKQQYGLPRQELNTQIAKLMGYSRCTSNMQDIINTAIDNLLSSEEAVIQDDQIKSSQ
jgi:very-short-patch-repair endonuclease/deoxyadenosine/deoxycytidine kinase